MDPIDARDVVLARLSALPDAPPIRWPGERSASGALPRIEVQQAAASARPLLMDGGHAYTGEIAAIVVAKGENGTGETDAIVRALYDWFRPPLTLDGVVIVDAPDVRPPLVTGTEFRVPVLIRYRALL